MLHKGFAHYFVKSTILKPGIKTFEDTYSRFSKKYPIAVWCIDTKEEARKMEKLGVRMVITNSIDKLF